MKVVFRPSRTGLNKIFGSAELPVLETLWEKGALTGRGIYEEVSRSKDLAYTTVLTVVGRMVKKGSIKRRRVAGVFVFDAVLNRAEFERHLASEVIKGIIEISPAHALAAFVDTLSEMDERRLDEIMGIIEKGRKADVSLNLGTVYQAAIKQKRSWRKE